MNPHALLEHTDGYLYAQWRDAPESRPAPPSPAPFVTISAQAGSGGSELARLLIRKLNADAPATVTWRVYEGTLTAKMLQANALPSSIARFLPEDRVSEFGATIRELVGLHPNLWVLRQKMSESLRQLATAGHVVLVGRGANFATRHLPHGVHVRVVAPPGHRARALADQYNVSDAEAAALNAKLEAARRRYVRANFGAELDDPGAYDLVVNTGRLPLPAAVDLVCARLRGLFAPAHAPVGSRLSSAA